MRQIALSFYLHFIFFLTIFFAPGTQRHQQEIILFKCLIKIFVKYLIFKLKYYCCGGRGVSAREKINSGKINEKGEKEKGNREKMLKNALKGLAL